jgi:hypothetical protein
MERRGSCDMAGKAATGSGRAQRERARDKSAPKKATEPPSQFFLLVLATLCIRSLQVKHRFTLALTVLGSDQTITVEGLILSHLTAAYDQ